MQRNTVNGYLLFTALWLIGLAALFALLVLGQIDQDDRRMRIEQTDHGLIRLLELQVTPLIQSLAALVQDSTVATAHYQDPQSQHEWLEPRIIHTDGSHTLLASAVSTDAERLVFQSPFSASGIGTGWIATDGAAGGTRTALAWAIEDISLSNPGSHVPAFWPLPDWNLAIGRNSDTLPCPPALQPEQPVALAATHLPFLQWNPDTDPGLNPVPVKLELRWGIFASGPERSREKIIRIRYYVTGELWNPYHRPLVFHNGSTLQPLAQVVFWNLPELRISNLTQGLRSAWLPLDTSINSATGSTGISAWIRLPARIEAGEVWHFHEPDAIRQPEGLTRTLHGGFLVAAADAIRLEFRSPATASGCALLDMSADDPLSSALGGSGWWRIEGYPLQLPEQMYSRADHGEQPFLIPAGSLAFRWQNCQTTLTARAAPAILDYRFDPRLPVIIADQLYPTAEGTRLAGTGIYSLESQDLLRSGAASRDNGDSPHWREPVYSIPYVADADNALPQLQARLYNQSFRWGSPQAKSWNALLDDPSNWPWQWQPLPAGLPGLPESFSWFPFFHLNTTDAAAWEAYLGAAWAAAPQSKIARYAHADPAKDDDWVSVDESEVRRLAAILAAASKANPLAQVSAFFDSGRLVSSRLNGHDSSNGAFLPLRGWLRKAPPLRSRGSSFILHIAAKVMANETIHVRSARVWIIETIQTGPHGEPATGWAVLRFELTDPQLHLLADASNAKHI